MNKVFKYLNTPFLKHSMFWVIVFLYFILSVNNHSMYASYRHLFESYGIIVIAQIIIAYASIYVLIPKFLNKKKIGLFILWMLILLVLVHAVYQAVRMYYFDVVYFDSYDAVQRSFAVDTYWKRLSSYSLFISKCVLYLTPTALLLMARFYKNQQKFLKLNEQKKIAELTALKNQLNPHFLFNTLNNLYSLTLDKSNKAPEVIERLSDILDYILYRCKENYVPIHKEIELIENYLTLEKIRYGKRVAIKFDHQIEKELKIAPLLLLTFVENAFKHGVSQELGQAKIEIYLNFENRNITFSVFNSKPNIPEEIQQENDEHLGLQNIKKQLELLYPNSYDLQIIEKEDSYDVTLKLNAK